MSRQTLIKASEGHRAFGKLLKRVYHSDEHLIVERDGFPVAVLMSYQEYQRVRGPSQALTSFGALAQEVGQEATHQGQTEEQLLNELRQTRKALFRERYGAVE